MQLSDAKRSRRRWISSQPNETKSPGRPCNKAVQKIMRKEVSRTTSWKSGRLVLSTED
jgi:hypothetical protein